MKHANTKQLKDAYARYLTSTATTLEDVYTTYSSAKAQAFNYCLDLATKHNGTTVYILGANSNTFSAGFVGIINGKQAFVYITKSYDRYIYLDEIKGV